VSLISLIITLAVVGLLLWLATTYIPMNDTIKKILIGVVVCVTILWLLSVFGVIGTISNVQVPRLH
jgi:hypothetical protein